MKPQTQNILHKIAAVLSLLLITQLAVAQDFKKALLDMRKAYEQMNRLHIVMQIKAFDQKEDKEPFYNETADIKKDGEKYCYLFGESEMFMNEKRMIMVDHNSKEMVHSFRQQNLPDAFQDMFAMNIDSILNFYDAPTYIGMKSGAHHYQIYQKDGPVDLIEMSLSASSGFLKTIKYNYKAGQRVAIEFKVFDGNPNFTANTFSEKRYVIASGSELKTAAIFKDYTFYDQSIQE